MGKRKLKSQDKANLARHAKPAKLETPWDTGAPGPAARAREQVVEDAFDVDPETGEIRNPNGIRRVRIVDMLEVWHRKGVISTAGYNFAVKLRDAFEATQRAPGWPDNDRVQSSPKPDHVAAIHADRMTAFRAYTRFVHGGDWAVIDYLVLLNRETAITGFRYQAMLKELGPALDRCAAAMDNPQRRLWQKVAK